MYTQVTHGIQVSVLPEYLAERSRPEEGLWVWAYTIEISNVDAPTTRLVSRHWTITDSAGHVETVSGPGVVGEQPVLQPGETFRYTSGCPLRTPSGIMVGTFQMVREDGTTFDAAVPAFSLDSPTARRVLN